MFAKPERGRLVGAFKQSENRRKFKNMQRHFRLTLRANRRTSRPRSNFLEQANEKRFLDIYKLKFKCISDKLK